MILLDPAFLTSLAALLTAASSLIWAIRRRPERQAPSAKRLNSMADCHRHGYTLRVD